MIEYTILVKKLTNSTRLGLTRYSKKARLNLALKLSQKGTEF